ncbi:MAG: hypothetical protein SH817_08035 [Leptospira sp.]|nr:hypothetical protein [Leptospira sp.]
MKLNQELICTAIFLSVAISPLFAHGEHKPGPHGGEIRMPGAFHTEVSSYKDLGFKVYLLDINFENPISKDSYVQGKVLSKGKEIALKCSTHPDHFYCEFPKGISLNEGELILSPTRAGNKGAEAKYKLPLNESKEHNHG